MEITTVGIDLAKTVFQVHAVDQHGNKLNGALAAAIATACALAQAQTSNVQIYGLLDSAIVIDNGGPKGS
jgi:transposase